MEGGLTRRLAKFKEFSRMPSAMRIPELNELARKLCGDFGTPNLYFVKVGGDVQMVTTDYHQAYRFWKGLSTSQQTLEPSLADRYYGVICSIEKGLIANDPNGYMVLDLSEDFMRDFMFNKHGHHNAS